MADRRPDHPLREHARGVLYVVVLAGAVLLAGLTIMALFVWAVA